MPADLSPRDRARVVACMEDHLPDLAGIVATQLDEGSAVARAVHDLGRSMTALGATFRDEQAASREHMSQELRQVRAQVLILVALAMMINGAIVGVGVRMGLGSQTIQVAPAGHVSVPMPTVPGAPLPMPDVPVPVLIPRDMPGPELSEADGDAALMPTDTEAP